MLDIHEIQRQVQGHLTSWASQIPRLVMGFLVWLILSWIARAMVGAIRRGLLQRHQSSTIDILTRLAKMGLSILAVLVAMSVAFPSFSLSAMVATLGLGSIAIGFAFKDILENFLAGLFILINRPFKIGDVIEVKDVRGTIKDIQMRSSTIELFNKEIIVMPNAILFKEPVHVAAASQNPVRRFELIVGVDYQSDLEMVEKVTLETVASVSGVSIDPTPMVVFDKFNDSSIDFTLYWWVDTSAENPLKIKSAVVKLIQKAFRENDINIPFPVRTVIREDTAAP